MSLDAAVTGLTAAYQVLRGAIAARDDALIQRAQYDLQEKLLTVSATALTQLQATHALELETQKLRTELVQADARVQEKERELEKRTAYKMAQPAPGIWARIPVDATAGEPESTAYFCATCYADGKEVPLQYRKAGPGYHAGLYCQVNKDHVLNLGGALPAPTPRRLVGVTNPRW
jgi:hypothetical protein